MQGEIDDEKPTKKRYPSNTCHTKKSSNECSNLMVLLNHFHKNNMHDAGFTANGFSVSYA